ncbi:MAG: Hpt domain-containing protein [Gammaproteobacteria bacterium]|nr:Hpt domain-containing protein [Gammaproteobacteria bacterium]
MTEKITVHIDPDLEDLIPGFLSNRQRDVDTIRALIDDDIERVRILGHSMKGAGGGYGFDEITELGAKIEQAAQAGDKPTILAATDALEDYLHRVDPVFDGQ